MHEYRFPVERFVSRRLTWTLDNPNDIEDALLTQLHANALRRARPEFFQLAHKATRSGIRNRLELFNRDEKKSC